MFNPRAEHKDNVVTQIAATAVLVDVDKTLLLGRDGEYNLPLIQALGNCGIKEIYLFTAMSMREIIEEIINPDYSSRPKLILELARHGIKVIAVLTPADVSYNKGLGAAFNDLFLKHHKRIHKNGKGDLMDATDEEFVADFKIFSQLISDTASALGNKQTSKSKLFEFFIAQQPKAASFIVIDDQKDDLDAIRLVKSEGTLTCVHVKKDSNQVYFEKEIQAHQLNYLKNLLLKNLSSESFDKVFFERCIKEMIEQGKKAEAVKNFNGGYKYYEIAFYIADKLNLPKKSIDEILDHVNRARNQDKASKGNQFFDNEGVDNLYREIFKLDPAQMQMRRVKLKIALFKLNHGGVIKGLFSKEDQRVQEFKNSILMPLANLVLEFPELKNDGLAFLNEVKSLIPKIEFEYALKMFGELKDKKTFNNRTQAIESSLLKIFPRPLISLVAAYAEESTKDEKDDKPLVGAVPSEDYTFKVAMIFPKSHENQYMLMLHNADSFQNISNLNNNVRYRMYIYCVDIDDSVRLYGTRKADMVVVCLDATSDSEAKEVKDIFQRYYYEDNKQKLLLLTNHNGLGKAVLKCPHEQQYRELAKDHQAQFAMIGSASFEEMLQVVGKQVEKRIEQMRKDEPQQNEGNKSRRP